MSAAIELYCKVGTLEPEEQRLIDFVSQRGGKIDFRELNYSKTATILTFVFNDWTLAKDVKDELCEQCEIVKGPMEYE